MDLSSLLSSLDLPWAAISLDDPVEPEAVEQYRRWIAEGRHGEMAYLEKYPDLRLDPRTLLEGARTLIVVAFPYYTEEKIKLPISLYARGRDYHEVVRERLTEVASLLPGETRVCVDTAPLRERYWAARAGLGFIGRNNQLIIPGLGSYFFLGFILFNGQLTMDNGQCAVDNGQLTVDNGQWAVGNGQLTMDNGQCAVDNGQLTVDNGPWAVGRDNCQLSTVNCQLSTAQGCGSCRRCVDACPGKCLSLDGRGLDARRCLSYLTIEYRGPLSASNSQLSTFHSPLSTFNSPLPTLYGCDICQRVCPHNANAAATPIADFHPSEALANLTADDVRNMTPEQFSAIFRHSAIKRTKLSGLQRNLDAMTPRPAVPVTTRYAATATLTSSSASATPSDSPSSNSAKPAPAGATEW